MHVRLAVAKRTGADQQTPDSTFGPEKHERENILALAALHSPNTRAACTRETWSTFRPRADIKLLLYHTATEFSNRIGQRVLIQFLEQLLQ